MHYLCDHIQGNSNVHSWIKSIDICSLSDSNEVVAYSEHPITMDENTSNVSFIQEKLSREAFGGSSVKLLNSKNILIADAEGTQGTCMHDIVSVSVQN